MNLQPPILGALCISLTGRDKGRTYMLVQILDPDFVLLADGQVRSVKNPKKKRFKHVKQLSVLPLTQEQLAKLSQSKLKDNEIHRVIVNYRNEGMAVSPKNLTPP